MTHNHLIPQGDPQLIDCLPQSEFKSLVQYIAHSIQIPEDFVLLNLLGAANIAINGKAAVEINSTYTEPIQLYFMPIADSGDRKSAVLKVAKKPNLDHERKMRIEWEELYGDYDE